MNSYNLHKKGNLFQLKMQDFEHLEYPDHFIRYESKYCIFPA